jgi:hypothetical protein
MITPPKKQTDKPGDAFEDTAFERKLEIIISSGM